MVLIAGAVLGAGALVGWMGGRAKKKSAAAQMAAQQRQLAEQNANLDLSAQASAQRASSEQELVQRRIEAESRITHAQQAVDGPEVDLNLDTSEERSRRRNFADPFAS